MRRQIYLFIFLFLCFHWSCQQQDTLARSDWELSGPLTYQDSFLFSFEVLDTSQRYFLGMDVSYDYISYPFQNIYFQITTRYPDGEQQEELLNLDFSNKQGLIKGSCLGANCQLPLYLQRSIQFDLEGTYHIQLVQHTRKDSLEGIQSMSLVLGAEKD